MDEYEKYEIRLKELYQLYVLNFRNLTYLRKVHDDLAKSERHRQEENEKSMRMAVEKMRLEQEKKNNLGLTDDDIDAPLIEQRPGVRKVYGNMTGAGMSDDEDEDDDDDDDLPGGGEAGKKSILRRMNSEDRLDDDQDLINGGSEDQDEEKAELSSGDDF